MRTAILILLLTLALASGPAVWPLAYARSTAGGSRQHGTHEPVNNLGGSSAHDLAIWPFAAPAAAVEAGADQMVLTGETVTLEGSGTGIEGYAWQQTAGRTVMLIAPEAASTTFTAPAMTDTLTFQLTGTGSGGITATDTVTINVLPLIADAGSDQSAAPGQPVTLTSQSRSPASAPIDRYQWAQIAGRGIQLRTTIQETLTFTLPLQHDLSVPELEFALTVTNTLGISASDTVIVRSQAGTILALPMIRR